MPELRRSDRRRVGIAAARAIACTVAWASRPCVPGASCPWGPSCCSASCTGETPVRRMGKMPMPRPSTCDCPVTAAHPKGGPPAGASPALATICAYGGCGVRGASWIRFFCVVWVCSSCLSKLLSPRHGRSGQPGKPGIIRQVSPQSNGKSQHQPQPVVRLTCPSDAVSPCSVGLSYPTFHVELLPHWEEVSSPRWRMV
jgi:hypothetical protein